MKTSRLLFLVLPLVATSLAHAAGPSPEDQIKARKAGYTFMAWNMGKIKANLDGTYNAQQVASAANAIAAIANSGMGALFGPGTEKSVGDQKTRVKPEFFTQPEKVKELAMDYIRETDALARAASTNNAAAVRSQFGKTGATCKACHEAFRMD